MNSLSLDQQLAISGLVLNALVAFAAIYIAYLALVHTAKPRISVFLHEPRKQPCSRTLELHYELTNRGFWYALPPAIDVTIFCDFDPAFEPICLGYGSQQEMNATEVRIGKGGRKFLKAKGLKLIADDLGEIIRIQVRTPPVPGRYLTRISAYSVNGLSHFEDFYIECHMEEESYEGQCRMPSLRHTD
jgi:hypothetical protein